MSLLSVAAYAHFSTTLSVGTRVYPRRLPMNAIMPAVTFQVIPAVGALKTHSDAHSSGNVASAMQVRMQFDAWASTYNDMEDLAQELRQQLQGFNGTWGTLKINSVHTDLDFDSYDQEIDNYRRIIDCMVKYNEPARV